MIETGFASLAVADGIGTITFGHPRGNSLPGALLRELAATIEAAGQNDAIRVIRLQSGGTGPFCAGASFDELATIADADQGLEFFSGFMRVILALKRCPRFVITRVHGKAAGGAVGLIAASDYCIAHTSAALRLSELAVGIGPFVVGPPIQHKIGLAHFAAMTVDHDWRPASWGLQTGLYARVEDTIEAVDAAVDALCRRLAAAHPAAMAQLKQVFWEGTDHWDTLLRARAAMSGSLVLSEHSRRAIAAFAR